MNAADWVTADGPDSTTAEAPLRVLVADRSLAFAEALSQLLRERHGVVASAAAIEAAPAEASTLQPSVVLLDGDQPIGVVREAVRAIQDAVPPAQVVVLRREPALDGARLAADVGATGWLSRQLDVDSLIRSLEDV